MLLNSFNFMEVIIMIKSRKIRIIVILMFIFVDIIGLIKNPSLMPMTLYLISLGIFVFSLIKELYLKFK